jgi:translocator protein
MELLKAFGFIAVCELAGALGALSTVKCIPAWYATLHKPSFSPPNWVFGPVWTMLYALMGISVYLVYRAAPDVISSGRVSVGVRSNAEAVRFALIVFFVHLFFNGIWSLIFFGMHRPGLAFLDILVILGMIVWLIFLFGKIDILAAVLLVPYLLWVSFASALNFAIWRLN